VDYFQENHRLAFPNRLKKEKHPSASMRKKKKKRKIQHFSGKEKKGVAAIQGKAANLCFGGKEERRLHCPMGGRAARSGQKEGRETGFLQKGGGAYTLPKADRGKGLFLGRGV